jgi:hypothetical protein
VLAHAKLRKDSERERIVQTRRLGQLEGERKKLLDAHYADAIPLDLLKSEQDRLTREIANGEGRLADIASDLKAAETNLERAPTRAGDCAAAHHEANDRLRRQFNMAFFKRLLLSDEGAVTAEFAEPFDALLGEELRGAAISQAKHVNETLRQRARHELADNEQRPQEPVSAPAGAEPPALDERVGFSPKILVHLVGQLSNPSPSLRSILDALLNIESSD